MARFEAFRLENFRYEYREVSSYIRLIASFRIGLLSVSPVLLGALIRFMWEVAQRESGLLLRVSLPPAGVIAVIALFLLERRLTELYDLLTARGADLETILDIHDGVYQRIIRLVSSLLLRFISQVLLTLAGGLLLLISLFQIIGFLYGFI